MMRSTLILMMAAIMPLLLWGTAVAYPGPGHGAVGWGPRLGLTVNPDQVHFGMHMNFGGFSPGVRFVPNFELGFGDNETLGALNFEANYVFNSSRSQWAPYLGGGVGANFIGPENGGLRDRSDTEVGMNVVGGIERGISSTTSFFAEAKLGLIQAPDLKLTLGWTFFH